MLYAIYTRFGQPIVQGWILEREQKKMAIFSGSVRQPFLLHRFRDAFFLVFFEILKLCGSDVGSILAPFSFISAYLLSPVFANVFHQFALISGTLNPPNHRFTLVNHRSTENHPTKTI